jgi:hypothetical protein
MAAAPDKNNLGTNTIPDTTTNPGHITVAINSDVAAGGKVCVDVGWWTATSSTPSASDNSGNGYTWRLVLQASNGNDHVAALECDAPSGMASGTVVDVNYGTTTADGRGMGVSSFTGVKTGAKEATSSGTTNYSTGNITTAGTGSLIYAAMEADNLASGSTPTPPALELTDVNDATSGQAYASAYRIGTTAGSYAITGAWTNGTIFVTVGASFLETPTEPSISPDYTNFPKFILAKRSPV